MEYPRLVYKTNAATSLLCADEDAREAALKDGWFDTVPEALTGKALPRTDLSVTVFRESGGKMETYKAKDAEEAKLYIDADGWHVSADAATQAAIKAEWPADAAALDTRMGDLEQKTKAELTAYAARIGATVDAKAKPADILAAIRTRLQEPV